VGFKEKIFLGFGAAVLLCGSLGWAQTYEVNRITVLVNDSVGVKPAVLKHAEGEAAALFRRAGIEIEWVRCGATGDCRRPPRENEFVLHIVRNGKTRGDLVFGEAFLGSDGRGKYADVFFDRLRQASDINIGQLLGAVSAHELGHLLLGSSSHSLMGIMSPIWRKESLQKISMGNLTFTREQEKLMNSRLGNERVVVTSSRNLVP
jgi:hypothetical protein